MSELADSGPCKRPELCLATGTREGQSYYLQTSPTPQMASRLSDWFNEAPLSTGLFLGLAPQSGCCKIVFSSTCAVYGEPAEIPIREAAPRNAVNPYGASKAMVERILGDCASAYDTKFVALRYLNACGADPESEIGEMRDSETHLIPRAMMAIQGYITDFAVFGTDYPTPDGTAIRDYVHVCDLADAHVASVKQLLEGGKSGSYNLGTGHGVSVMQVLDAIAAETGGQLPVRKGARRPGDPPILVANASLARADLYFQTKLSDLKTVVSTAWAWHRRAHPKRTNPQLLPTGLSSSR